MKHLSSNFLRSMYGIAAAFSTIGGGVATALTAIVLYQMPYHPSVWLAMALSIFATVFAASYLVNGLRNAGRQESRHDEGPAV